MIFWISMIKVQYKRLAQINKESLFSILYKQKVRRIVMFQSGKIRKVMKKNKKERKRKKTEKKLLK